MAKMIVDIDPVANVFQIWWGDKKKAHESIESSDPNMDAVIIVDKEGHPLSVEIINFFPNELDISKKLSSKEIDYYFSTGKLPFGKSVKKILSEKKLLQK